MSSKRNLFSNRTSLFRLLYQKKKKWTLSLQPNGKFLIHFLTLLEMKVLSVFRGEDYYWMLMSSGCF